MNSNEILNFITISFLIALKVRKSAIFLLVILKKNRKKKFSGAMKNNFL